MSAVLRMPIDMSQLRPDPDRVEPGLIGFMGRYDDARKNAGLFIASLAALIRAGVAARGILIGSRPTAALLKHARELRVQDRLQFVDFLPRDEIAKLLPTIDVFLIPSAQEGLCIAGLEAMAAGCPVVSTRCGGPEEYVRDGVTGYLVDSEVEEISAVIARIATNRSLRGRLSKGARHLIQHAYSFAVAEEIFWREFEATFPGATRCLPS